MIITIIFYVIVDMHFQMTTTTSAGIFSDALHNKIA